MPKNVLFNVCIRILAGSGNIGFQEIKVTPTVVIYVKPGASFRWSSLRLQVLALTNDDPTIDVVFRPGGISNTTNSDSSSSKISLAVHAGEPGFSIGVQEAPSSGTLGGYFNLKYQGRIRTGFLTNYHVVAPSRERPNIQMIADMFGSNPSSISEIRSEVVAPSEEDVSAEVATVNRVINTLNKQMTAMETRKEMVEACGDSRQRIELINVGINSKREQIRTAEKDLAQLHELPIRLGKVFLSSGRTIFKERISDWAFIELHSTITPFTNTMPSYSGRQARDPRLRASGVAAPGTPATGIGKIEKSELYLKEGRATGVTVGECNGIKFFIPRGTRYYVEGVEQTIIGTHEFVILSIDSKHDFCEPGDSGSLVYDIYGKISGLLFAEIIGQSGPRMGLVTSFPRVLDAIKQKGGTLTLINAPSQ